MAVVTRLVLTCDTPGCGAEREVRVQVSLVRPAGGGAYKDRMVADSRKAEDVARSYGWKLDSVTGRCACPTHSGR